PARGPGRPPAADAPPFRAVHYPAEEIRRRLLGVYLDPRGAQMSGKSVNFGNAALEGDRTTAPTLMLAMNSLLPGEAQRGHRHNAGAVTMVVAWDPICSRLHSDTLDCAPHALMSTPRARSPTH